MGPYDAVATEPMLTNRTEDRQHQALLLVEDDADHAKLVQWHLKKAAPDVRVEHVTTLRAALTRLAGGGVDLLLLDLGLPDSPPRQTLPALLGPHPHLPVIVLTDDNDLEVGGTAVSQGAQDFLVKTHLSGEVLLRAMRYAVERKKIQAELQRSNEALQNFAHTVAHEVRGPLNTVVCGLQLLQVKYGHVLDEAGNKSLQDVLRATYGMSDLVTELLEFAKVGSRNRVLDRVEAGEALEQALAALHPVLAEAQAIVTHDPLPAVQADAVQLRHLLQNLIGNAVKYRGERPPRVHVRAEAGPDGWTFAVRDNGVGIAPADRQRVFDLFVRLHRTAAVPGTGIGLAFCKQIVEFHGGRIWVESEPGQGSTFYFTLPTLSPALTSSPYAADPAAHDHDRLSSHGP